MNHYFGQYIKNCRYTHPKCQNISCNYYDKLPRNILTFRVIHEQGSPLLLAVYLLYDCPKKINNPHYLVDIPFVSPLPNPLGHPGRGFMEIACGYFDVWSTWRGYCLLSSFFGSLVTPFWILILHARWLATGYNTKCPKDFLYLTTRPLTCISLLILTLHTLHNAAGYNL